MSGVELLGDSGLFTSMTATYTMDEDESGTVKFVLTESFSGSTETDESTGTYEISNEGKTLNVSLEGEPLVGSISISGNTYTFQPTDSDGIPHKQVATKQ